MRINIKYHDAFATLFKTVTKTELSLDIKGISTDTREILKDDLFIAIKGDNFDGNKLIKQALTAGASAALVNKVDTKVKEKD